MALHASQSLARASSLLSGPSSSGFYSVSSPPNVQLPDTTHGFAAAITGNLPDTTAIPTRPSRFLTETTPMIEDLSDKSLLLSSATASSTLAEITAPPLPRRIWGPLWNVAGLLSSVASGVSGYSLNWFTPLSLFRNACCLIHLCEYGCDQSWCGSDCGTRQREGDHPSSRTGDPNRETLVEDRLGWIPDYVLEYAPLVHLYSAEEFWPCDLAEHLLHITPYLNYTPIKPAWDHPTLRDLDRLNLIQKGRNVFLTSNDNVESRPDWLGGEKNIPNPFPSADSDSQLLDEPVPLPKSGALQQILRVFRTREAPMIPDAKKDSAAGRSSAPAILIVVDKGDGVVDAFWFYFYSFNLGNKVFNVRFGNHVGDWEHSLVRFHHGKPKAVYLSEHSFGDAYTYSAVEKIGRRPVIYSAEGSHANYATPGTHTYVLPWGLLYDRTDRGPLWDPSLNFHAYTYDSVNDTLTPSQLTPDVPIHWFYFSGHWGDKLYPFDDRRQYRFAGQYHYVSGPLGPRFKDLGRRSVCQGSSDRPCVIRDELDEPEIRRWTYVGEGEEPSGEDFNRFLAD